MTIVWRLRAVDREAWVADLHVNGQTFVDDEREAKQFTDPAAARRSASGINRRLDSPPVRVVEGRASPRRATSSSACR